MEVSKLSFTKWQWKSVLERIHLDFICKNPTYFNQPLDFQGYFWKKNIAQWFIFQKYFTSEERQENHIFILRSFFKRKTRLYTSGPSISTNNNIILTLYVILILYLILNHIKSMLRFCNKKRKILPILTYISIMIVTIVVIPVVMMVSLLYQTVLTVFVVGFSGWKTGVLKRGPFRFPYPLSFYRPIWTSQPYVMHYKMLSDIVIMTAALDYLICMFIIKFNNRENLFLEQNETLQPLQQ